MSQKPAGVHAGFETAHDISGGPSNLTPFVQPILFHLGGFPVRAFGILVGLGFVLGLWTSARRASRVGIDPNVVYDLGPWLLFAGLIGARALYVYTFWAREFAGQPFGEMFKIWNGGLVFYGGLILAILVGIVRVRMLKLPIWRLADALAPGIALGHVFGRMGCLLNGCCFGRGTDLPWAIRFPADHTTHGSGVHPAQVYESLLNLALYSVLSWGFNRRRFDGQIFALYLVAYAFVRSVSEYFRGDYSVISAPTQGVFTPGQAMSGLILLAGVIAYTFLRTRPSAPAPAPTPGANPTANGL